MKYQTRTLEGIYDTLAGLDEPLAVFDFVSGELGYEVLCAQALGGRFYDMHHADHKVVALCWAGCTAYYENISDVQIELTDGEFSTLGNKQHRGDKRWATLVLADHRERIDAMENVKAHKGPLYWAGGKRNEERLRGFIDKDYLLNKYGQRTNRSGLINTVSWRLCRHRTTFVNGEPLSEGAFMALFDRNERKSKERNTEGWQIDWMRQVARENNLNLVVISGFRQRRLPDDVKQYRMEHRNVDLLRRIIRQAAVFAAPPSGISELACVLGCNFLALGYMGIGHDQLAKMVDRCDHNYLGVLEGKKSAAAYQTVHFLKELCGG